MREGVFILVKFTIAKKLMSIEGFHENSSKLDNPKLAIGYGTSAYFVDADWLLTQTDYKDINNGT